jgi:hypothetical protein
LKRLHKANAGFLRADGMVSLLGDMYGISPYLARDCIIFRAWRVDQTARRLRVRGCPMRTHPIEFSAALPLANPDSDPAPGVVIEEADPGLFEG